jgi:hypothetical protein
VLGFLVETVRLVKKVILQEKALKTASLTYSCKFDLKLLRFVLKTKTVVPNCREKKTNLEQVKCLVKTVFVPSLFRQHFLFIGKPFSTNI